MCQEAGVWGVDPPPHSPDALGAWTSAFPSVECWEFISCLFPGGLVGGRERNPTWAAGSLRNGSAGADLGGPVSQGHQH